MAVKTVKREDINHVQMILAGPLLASCGVESTAGKKLFSYGSDFPELLEAKLEEQPVRFATLDRMQKQMARLCGQGSSLGRNWTCPSFRRLAWPLSNSALALPRWTSIKNVYCSRRVAVSFAGRSPRYTSTALPQNAGRSSSISKTRLCCARCSEA